jgi:hypothetical protein
MDPSGLLCNTVAQGPSLQVLSQLEAQIAAYLQAPMPQQSPIDVVALPPRMQ